MPFDMSTIIKKFSENVFSKKNNNPSYYDAPDDMRLFSLYFGISQNIYIYLCGCCPDCDSIMVYNNYDMPLNINILSNDGLKQYIDSPRNDDKYMILDIDLTLKCNKHLTIDDIILKVNDAIESNWRSNDFIHL